VIIVSNRDAVKGHLLLRCRFRQKDVYVCCDQFVSVIKICYMDAAECQLCSAEDSDNEDRISRNILEKLGIVHTHLSF